MQDIFGCSRRTRAPIRGDRFNDTQTTNPYDNDRTHENTYITPDEIYTVDVRPMTGELSMKLLKH